MSSTHDTPAEVLVKAIQKRPRPDVGTYVAPRDELEESLCQLWADVLSIDRVGRDDDILNLGGDSFHMLVIGARLFEAYRLEMSIGEFFERGTVESVAGYLRARTRQAKSVDAEPANHD